VLAAVGAALGVGLGAALAELRVALQPARGFTWAFPRAHAATACAVAVGVGLVAALLPAVRAVRQDPIEGLDDE
jgi:ABC-type lipoprotein release transport system permease subunit